MNFLDAKCKICGGKVVAKWEDGAPQAAVDGWLPMLTCDRCSDLRWKRNESGGSIVNACWRYQHAKDQGKIVAEVRQSLLLATRAYAEAITGILRAPAIIWSEAFADCLLHSPDQCARILREYRAEVRRSTKENA